MAKILIRLFRSLRDGFEDYNVLVIQMMSAKFYRKRKRIFRNNEIKCFNTEEKILLPVDHIEVDFA
jgi:hypothetical protein